ncbi:MAG: hypothetical protein J7M25_12780 [Deltaproteobacteria bacterium]|nr:hypothetical protein [Deltaproteobacteria bacterium]
MADTEKAELTLLSFVRPVNREVTRQNPLALEELSCKRGDVNFYLLVNRRHKSLRVLDYRIGNYQLKRNALDYLAKEQGLRKIYTLVEKQDSNSWRTVGFSREAVVPGYFRTADAYVMSRVYDEEGQPLTGGLSKVAVAHDIPEAKKPRKPSGLKLKVVIDPDRIQKVLHAKDTTEFYTPFGKGIQGPDVLVSAALDRKKFWVAGEINDSFGHAKVDLLSTPTTRREVYVCVFALKELFDRLEEHDVGSIFAFTSVENDLLGEVFASAGFRHTGQLTRHVCLNEDELEDMHTWHVRIAYPM